MSAVDPRYFIVTSHGVSATRWLAFALASNPKVFAAHGHFELDSVVGRKFEHEVAEDDTGALSLGNKARALYEKSIDRIFAEYRRARPDARAYGSVHSFTLETLQNRLKESRRANFAIANVVRHPVSFIDSHASLVRKAEAYPDVYENYEPYLFSRALSEFRELLLIDCPDFREFVAFTVSCASALAVARGLGYEGFEHHRMEALTQEVTALAAFCERLTGLAYSREQLDALIVAGAINRHRGASASRDERTIYNEWARWKQDVAAVMMSEEALKRFESVGYDVEMLRAHENTGRQANAGAPCLADCLRAVDKNHPLLHPSKGQA